jgi:hypothetical protein
MKPNKKLEPLTEEQARKKKRPHWTSIAYYFPEEMTREEAILAAERGRQIENMLQLREVKNEDK